MPDGDKSRGNSTLYYSYVRQIILNTAVDCGFMVEATLRGFNTQTGGLAPGMGFEPMRPVGPMASQSMPIQVQISRPARGFSPLIALTWLGYPGGFTLMSRFMFEPPLASYKSRPATKFLRCCLRELLNPVDRQLQVLSQ